MEPTIVSSPGGSFNVRISASDVPLQVHHRKSDNRPFVAGIAGSSYVISVRNLKQSRMLLVVSVDGQSVLNKEKASWSKSRGMILSPNQLYRFRGWRLNNDETAAFVFGDPGDSVSTMATGTDQNVGVIGLAGFSEPTYHARHVTAMPPVRDSLSATYRGAGPGGQSMSATYTSSNSGPTYDMAPVAGAAASVDYDMGTGIGAVQTDSVVDGRFNRAGITPDIVTIGYASYASLVQAGIISEQLPDRDPFPGQPEHDHPTGYEDFLRQ